MNTLPLLSNKDILELQIHATYLDNRVSKLMTKVNALDSQLSKKDKELTIEKEKMEQYVEEVGMLMNHSAMHKAIKEAQRENEQLKVDHEALKSSVTKHIKVAHEAAQYIETLKAENALLKMAIEQEVLFSISLLKKLEGVKVPFKVPETTADIEALVKSFNEGLANAVVYASR